MTLDEVAKLKDGEQLTLNTSPRGYRGKVDMMTEHLVRVEWFGHGYDVIRKTSPIWYSVERKL